MTTADRVPRRDFLRRTLTTGAAIVAARRLAGTAVESPGKKAWRIGCYTRPWGDQDWRVALDAIGEAGFRYAGLMTTKSKTRLVISPATTPEEARLVGEEARKRGLKILSAYGGGLPVGKSLAAGIEALRRLIDNCAAAGAKSLLMGGIGGPKLYDRYYRAIADCCDQAAEKGVEIALKPHGGLNATGPQCRKAVEIVRHTSFRLWYDPGNIYYYSDGKLDPVDDAPTVDGLVTGMCVKDYKDPKNVMVTPGTGRVDFPAVMARLKKGGFTSGSLVIETLAQGDLAARLREAKKARKFVEGLAAGS